MCLGQKFALFTRQPERKLVHAAGGRLQLGTARFDEYIVIEPGGAQVFEIYRRNGIRAPSPASIAAR